MSLSYIKMPTTHNPYEKEVVIISGGPIFISDTPHMRKRRDYFKTNTWMVRWF